MPELPEAETIVRDLRGRIVGRTVTAVRVTHVDVLEGELTPEGLDARVGGRTIDEVGRRGKNVVLRFASELRLVVNLGMTGRLVVSAAPRAADLRHVAVRFELDDGHALLYDDIRRFGRLELHSPESWAARDRELGIEPLSDDFTEERLFSLTRQSRTPIRNFLLDQRRVAGIGNIYANDALFLAGIRPGRQARSLSRRETARLREGLRTVLREAIQARGTTLRDYRDASGEAGGYEPKLRVYGREDEPCPNCGTPIRRIVLTNRSAFYCPRCQRRGATPPIVRQ